MDKDLIKEIILSNICVKENLVRKINTTLLIFRRDFNELKFKDAFNTAIEELITMLNFLVGQKDDLQEVLKEVETEGTLQGISLEQLTTKRLQEVSGNILQIENCGELEDALSSKVDTLLLSI